MFERPYLVAGLLLASAGATAAVAIAAHFAFFVVPLAWTHEPARLVDALGVRPGDRVADIGAGDGSHAVAVAKILGARGEVLATELDPARRRAIADTAAREAANVRVVEGQPAATNLPDRCCRAIYMRTMLHHVTDRAVFARDVVRSVEPGGRIAVIDFAPGHLWFHGHDHGVAPEDVVTAFSEAGCTLRVRDDRWGGPTFLLVFECEPVGRHSARQWVVATTSDAAARDRLLVHEGTT
jgi:SAM-dependent methyltransferase